LTVPESSVPDSVREALKKQEEDAIKRQIEYQERILALTIKANINKVERIMNVKKNDTFEALKLKILSTFELNDIAPEDARVRGYEPYVDKMTVPYSGEKE
jgi:hypothetical protein